MIIEFQIENQIIMRLDNQTVVGDSKNYLYARFIFTDDWNSVQKTAQFTRLPTAYQQATTYNVLIDDDNMCLVPYQVLQERGTVRLNVFGGDLITTKPVDFPVIASGLLPGELPDEPQPGYFQQVVEYLATDFKGDKGDKGEQGDKGDKGDKGDPGEVTNAEMLAVTGDQTYTEQNYVTNGESITASLNALDVSVNAAFDAIDTNLNLFLPISSGAGFHNSIFRGKYLGSVVTTEQYSAISSGTFDDLYIGDYWSIGGINWRIAALNYYYNTGDTAFTNNHAVIVPDTVLYDHVMNDTNIVTGAYVGSKMYISGLNSAKTSINSAFSGHVVSHRNYLHNAVTSNYTSAGGWYDSTVELMTEANVYGAKHYGNALQGTGMANNVCVDKSQFSLFALNPQSVNTMQTYWLRDVSSSTSFAYVDPSGVASTTNSSNSFGVRPAFCIS